MCLEFVCRRVRWWAYGYFKQEKMKKVLMLLALICICATTVEAQHFIPKYKRKKEIRDYELAKPDRKLEIWVGGSYNMALGMQNHIKYSDYGYNVKYDQSPEVTGGTIHLGAAYKFGDNITTGLEAGVLFQDNGYAMPVYGTFNYYFGKPVVQHRYRPFVYANLGPQFYMSSRSKPIGAMAGAGGGLRVLLARQMRLDLFLGYQNNMRRAEIKAGGSYDVNVANVHYKQYTHLLQLGMKIYIF